MGQWVSSDVRGMCGYAMDGAAVRGLDSVGHNDTHGSQIVEQLDLLQKSARTPFHLQGGRGVGASVACCRPGASLGRGQGWWRTSTMLPASSAAFRIQSEGAVPSSGSLQAVGGSARTTGPDL